MNALYRYIGIFKKKFRTASYKRFQITVSTFFNFPECINEFPNMLDVPSLIPCGAFCLLFLHGYWFYLKDLTYENTNSTFGCWFYLQDLMYENINSTFGCWFYLKDLMYENTNSTFGCWFYLQDLMYENTNSTFPLGRVGHVYYFRVHLTDLYNCVGANSELAYAL